jgi:hypothetical protein
MWMAKDEIGAVDKLRESSRSSSWVCRQVPVAGLERKEIVSRISDLRHGTVHGELKLQVRELEQHVAFRDLLIAVNRDFRDDSGQVG